MSLGVVGCAKSGTGVGVVTKAGKPTGQVGFAWDSGSESISGNIATTLPGGETYRGRFTELTSDYVTPYAGDYFTGWDAGLGYGYGYGWDYAYGGPYWTTEYSGVVVAALTSDQGNTMRCVFRLENPAAGLSGGGLGRCRTSEGVTIENAIVSEGQEAWARRPIQPGAQPSTPPSG